MQPPITMYTQFDYLMHSRFRYTFMNKMKNTGNSSEQKVDLLALITVNSDATSLENGETYW